MTFTEYAEKMKQLPLAEDIEIRREGAWFYHNSGYAAITNIGESELDKAVIKIPQAVEYGIDKSFMISRFPRDAFKDRDNLTDIIFPSSIWNIPEGAFRGCSSLKRITISKNVSVIGEGTFAGCGSLSDIYYEGTRQEWEKIRIVHIRREYEFGELIPGTPVQQITGERQMIIPGNEALFTANLHFRCDLAKLYNRRD